MHGFNGFLSRDLGIYAYAGQRVADGVPPYLGVLNRAGPLAHLLPGVGVVIARTVGMDDVLGLRLLFMVFAVAAVCMTYVVGRNLFRTPWAGLVAAASLTCLGGFIEYAADGPREKTPMVLLVVLSLWAMERRRWLLTGVFISLATLTLQIAFFALMPAAIVAVLVMPRGERLRSLVQVAFGGLIPVVVFGLLAAVTGSLSASVNAFLLINARYTVPQPITGDLPKAWASMIDGYGVTVWVVVLGLAAMIVLGLLALRPATWRKDDSQPMVAALGIATIVGLVWKLRRLRRLGRRLPGAADGRARLRRTGQGRRRHAPAARLPGPGRRMDRAGPAGRDRLLGHHPRRPAGGPARVGRRRHQGAAVRVVDRVDPGTHPAGAVATQEPDALPDVLERALHLPRRHLPRRHRRLRPLHQAHPAHGDRDRQAPAAMDRRDARLGLPAGRSGAGLDVVRPQVARPGRAGPHPHGEPPRGSGRQAMKVTQNQTAALAIGSAVERPAGLPALRPHHPRPRRAEAGPVSVLWSYWAFAGAAITFPLQHWAARTIIAHGEGAVRHVPGLRGARRAVGAPGALAWLARQPLFHRPDFWFPAMVAAVTFGSGAIGRCAAA